AGAEIDIDVVQPDSSLLDQSLVRARVGRRDILVLHHLRTAVGMDADGLGHVVLRRVDLGPVRWVRSRGIRLVFGMRCQISMATGFSSASSQRLVTTPSP